MRLEALTRLIETADFLSFRELALRVLSMRGYVHPTLTDGPRDGGTDVVVAQLPPNPTRVAIQLSVEKRWPGKVRDEAQKITTKLALQDMVFVSSRRLPESDFQRVANEIFRDLNVRVTRIDSQGLASTLFENDATIDALRILGIETGLPVQPASQTSTRLDAAYSFVFFGAEPQRFRERMTEAAVVTVAAASQVGVVRHELEAQVLAVLQLPKERAPIVSGTVDRMIQRGDLKSTNGAVAIEPQLRQTAVSMHALREREWREMEADLVAKLSEEVAAVRWAPVVEATRDDLGAVLVSSADVTVQTLERSANRSFAEDTLRRRLRHLHATFDVHRVPTGDVRSQAIQIISDVVGASPISKHLVAGEVYSSLMRVSTPHLVKAMGAQSEIETYLDASVAIPMLANLMYEAVRQHRYFLGASHAYSRLRDLNLPVLLPPDYLEEVAVHLYLAYSDYSSIIDLDGDLIASQNAFVAHYSSLRLAGTKISFFQYLAGFGFSESLQRATLPVARDALVPILRRHFDRYRIKTVDLPRPSQRARKAAEESVARAVNALSLTRPSVLQHHDAHTLAALSERQMDASRAVVLCTWDSLHFWILDHEHPTWDVMDPTVLGDVLALTAPELDDAPLASISALTRIMTDDGARDGAVVWDTIARIERGSLHDAELIAQAGAFKRDYLTRKKQGLGAGDIGQAWMQWKSRESLEPRSAG